MAAENNIFIKITAESNLSDTQRDLQDTVNRAAELEEEYADLKRQMDDASRTAGRNSEAYRQLSDRVIQNRKSIQSLTKGVKLSDMSMNALRARAQNLRNALESVSKSANPKRFADLRHQLEQTEGAMGKLQKESMASKAKNMLGMKVAAGAAAAYWALKDAIRGAFNTIVEFDKANATLASVLGKTQLDIKDLTDDAKRLGAATSYTASEMTMLQTELAKLGFTTGEILQSTEAVQRFATATGAELPEAAALAGASLRAFGLDASEMERAVSAMAVGTSKSALDFRFLETAMSTIAPVAQSFGFTIEDTTTLLGTLANSGFDASSAATATRNILLNIADSSGKLAKALGRPVRSMDDLIPALQELNDKGIDLSETLELTDKRSVSAFKTFLSGSKSMNELRVSITGCEEELKAMEQERLNTVSGKIDLMKSAWDGLMLSMSGSKGVMKDVIEWITSIIDKTNNFVAGGGFTEWFASVFGDDEIKAEIAAKKKITEENKRQDEEIAKFRKLNLEEARKINEQKLKQEEEYERDIENKIQSANARGNYEEVAFYTQRLELSHQFREKRTKALEDMEKDLTARLANEEIRREEDSKKREKQSLEEAKKNRALRLQEEENKYNKNSINGGDEASYTEQIKLAKKIAEDSAQVQIDALNKMELGAREYNAQVESIRIDLQKKLKEIDDAELERQTENAKRATSIAVQQAKSEADALNGSEGTEERMRVWNNYYSERSRQIEENEQLELQALERETSTEEVKAKKREEIWAKYNQERNDNTKESSAKRIEIEEDSISELQRALTKAEDETSAAYTSADKLTALQNQYDAEMALYEAQQQSLEAKWAAHTISYQEYQDQLLEISRNRNQAEINLESNKMQVITDGLTTAMSYAQQVSDMVFEALDSQVQAELDALDEMYTTDAEEAKKDSNKKYITEEEYEKKKAALEEKQAKYAKAQALTNIAIQTALSIMNAMASAPFPLNIAMAALAGTMGAAQLAIAAAKPLAQYEKGRNGGEGEYALVGEKGAEIMYIPKGASIIPHDKIGNQDAWGAYGVPKLNVPELPNTNVTDYDHNWTTTTTIDYDKLGEAVARNIPSQKTVSVNIDRNGIVVKDGNATSKYLNRKYTGTWN